MAGKLETRSRDLLRILRKGVPAIVQKNAERILHASNQTIETHKGGAGQALGPGSREQDLIASGYVALDSDTGDKAYAAARDSMLTTFATRTAKRKQVAAPVRPEKQPGAARAIVAYAADHASLLHNGYDDPRAHRYMKGTPFLYNAALDNESQFFSDIEDLVKSLESVHVLSEPEKIEAYHQKELASSARRAAIARQEMYREFLASIGSQELRRQKSGGLQRVTKHGKKIYYTETAAERNQRVAEMYQSWLSMRNARWE